VKFRQFVERITRSMYIAVWTWCRL